MFQRENIFQNIFLYVCDHLNIKHNNSFHALWFGTYFIRMRVEKHFIQQKKPTLNSINSMLCCIIKGSKGEHIQINISKLTFLQNDYVSILLFSIFN